MIKQRILALIGVIFLVVSVSPILTSPNQPNSNPVGYEIINNTTAHIWNNRTLCDEHLGCMDYGDDYYIDLDTGLQFTNHYNQYWSRNVFCGGAKPANSWIYYCTDALPFSWSVSSDNLTHVNMTGNLTVNFGSRIVDFSLEYYLGVNDTNLTVIPKARNIESVSINFPIGFLWKIKDIQISMNSTENYAAVLNKSISDTVTYRLNDTLNVTFDDLSDRQVYLYRYKNNASNPVDHDKLAIYFQKQQNYSVRIESEIGQYNAPVSLFFPLGTLPTGASKNVTFGWIDARIPACMPLTSPLDVNVTFFVNGTPTHYVNEVFTDETVFNMSVKWTGFGSGSCNGFFDNVYSNGFGPITTNYMTTVALDAEFKNVSKFSNPGQGGEFFVNARYNISVMCGFRHDMVTEAQGWVASVLGRNNISCYDRIKPWIISASPQNLSTLNSNNISFQVNASDNTNLSALEFYENWTLGNGQYNLNQSIRPNDKLLYNYSWNLSFFLGTGNYSWYIRMNDTNPENSNTSGIFVFTVEIVVDENEARTAILEGINNIIPNATITSDQQVYLVNQTGYHSTGRFDEVAILGNQTWAFNYLTGGEQFQSVTSMLNIVNIWQNQSLTYTQIVKNVEQFINETKQ